MKAVSFLCILGFAAIAITAGDPPATSQQPAEAAQTTVPTPVQPTPAAAQPAAAGGAGMVVTIDPERGTVVDGAAELSDEMREALAEMINTSSEGLKEVTLADGTVLVDLKGRFRSAMVATVGEDGKVRTSCLSSDPKHQHSDSCSNHQEDKPQNH